MRRLWFWLTYSTICSWCGHTLHRAWLPWPQERMTRQWRVPRITHGICPTCARKVVE